MRTVTLTEIAKEANITARKARAIMRTEHDIPERLDVSRWVFAMRDKRRVMKLLNKKA